VRGGAREGVGDVGDGIFEPGQIVRHPGRPDWGTGQVQSVVGDRVTVNFEHAGKLLINTANTGLDLVESAPR